MEVAQGYHLIEIPERGIKWDMPQHLAYCDARQFAEMADLFYRYLSGSIDYEQLRYLAVYRLLNLKRAEEHRDEELEQKKNVNIYQISTYLDSFFQPREKKTDPIVIRQEYVHNAIPEVRYRFKKYYGPADHMEDITFGQYVDALNIFAMYALEPQKELLYNLWAIFYQPKKFKQAKKFDKHGVDARARMARQIYWGNIFGFYLFFASFQEYLATATVHYEGRELDLSILYIESKDKFKSRIPGIGMKSTAFMLAETSAFGSLDEVEQAPFWTIILRMYDIKKRDLDNEAREKQKKK